MTEFDNEFKDKVLALNLRDQNFCERIDGLIQPDFFDNEVDSYIILAVQQHYHKYKVNPSPVALVHKLKRDVADNIVRKEVAGPIGSKIKQLYQSDISDREFVLEEVASFVRKKATINAIEEAANIIDAGGDISTILPIMQKAIDVGTSDLVTAYDFKENLDQRLEIRKARLSGEIAYNSVTTGYKRFDECLYRRGWGKGELSMYMGASKGGKSIALLDHGIRACEKGHNVLFVSLEVSTEIQVDRMDANISGIKFDDIYTHFDKVKDRVGRWSEKAAKLILHEYPTGTFKVSDLRRLIKKYQAKGIIFDLVVLDYADIMLSESTGENIDKSKQVMVDLRALAQSENVALLTATQTNREGAKVDTIEAIHVAEDYNKIRIADLVISINAGDIEKEMGEARLHFAASRNQKPVTIRVKRDLSCMKHIREVLDVQ